MYIRYNPSTGRIIGEHIGNFNPARWGGSEAFLQVPDGTNTAGKMVDTSLDPPKLVDDPDYSEPYRLSEWVRDREAGNFADLSEAVDKLAEALS